MMNINTILSYAKTEGEFRTTMLSIICVAVLVLVTIIYLFLIFSKSSIKGYQSILMPSHNIGQAPRKDMQKDKKRYKPKKISLRERITNFLVKKGWKEKIESWYLQAGYKNKYAEDFILGFLKIGLIAIASGALFLYAFENILIALVPIILIFFPLINMFSEISERRNEFNRDFPYFLQTLAFVLDNGANMASAFEDVVKKQKDGVLKQVMLDVVQASKVEGGNFEKAFGTIPKQIDSEETREFIDIVQNQLQKGAPVADVFKMQSNNMTERFGIKQAKKIASASTKIFVPLLLIMCSIAIFFVSF